MPPKRASAPKAAATPTRGGGPAQERELRAQGRKTMRKLLDAGLAVFEKRGFHAARVDDIVKVARTSHGTFYLYFSNKEDLFRALVADVAEETTQLSGALGDIAPTEAGYHELRTWLSGFVDLYDRFGPVIRAWTEAEIDDSDIGRLGSDVLTRLTVALSERIEQSEAAGGLNPQVAALALVAMIERINYYVMSRRIDVDREELLDTLATIAHLGLFGGSGRVRKTASGRAT